MKTIRILTTTGNSKIYVGESFSNARKYINARDIVILIDEKVRDLYKKKYSDFFSKYKTVAITINEKAKELQTVEAIYKKFLSLGLDRSSFLLGIGGGALTDIAGFVASTYMRGIRFGFVPTTLLAQVDASIGGKNGVNFHGYKNTIGTITQPEFVINDISFLKTLPKKEFISGFSEVVKYALIKNERLFYYLEENYRDVQKISFKVLERIIYECVRIKARIVEKDTFENGERRKLNFGHTLGHAFEKTLHIRHGEAVSIGMIFAAELSEKYGLISKDFTARIRALLKNCGLPIHASFDKQKVIDALRKDKKKASDHIHFVFLKGIGKSVIKPLLINKLKEHINDMY